MKGNYLSSHVLTEPFQNFSFLNYILLNLIYNLLSGYLSDFKSSSNSDHIFTKYITKANLVACSDFRFICDIMMDYAILYRYDSVASASLFLILLPYCSQYLH